MTGFGTGWFDYDHDGWLDLFVANGAVNIVEALRGQPNPFRQRNQLFHNDGSGRFREVTSEAGPAFESAGGQPRRRVRRHRQRWRCRHPGHEQQWAGAAAVERAHYSFTASREPTGRHRTPDRRAGPRPPSPDLRTGWGSRYALRRRTASALGRASESCATASQPCGAAHGATAATSVRVITAFTSDSERAAPWTRWSSSGRTDLIERFSPVAPDALITLDRGAGHALPRSDR